MDIRYFTFMVSLVFAERSWTFPLGCRYEGTSYKDGEIVRAETPCLSCVCQGGALACNLRVCKDYLDALPQGCFLVHKPKDCCPQLFCEGDFSPYGIELRAVQNFEREAESESGSGKGNGCRINGTVYGEGSAVASSHPCEYCYCAEGGIKCVKPRCLQSFEGCKPVYENYSCCPTQFDCRDANINFLTSQIRSSENLNAKVSKVPLRSLVDTDLKPDKDLINVTISDKNLTQSEEEATEESVTPATATEEITTEVAAGDDEEATEKRPSSEDHLWSTLGFQAMKTANPGQELPALAVAEETMPNFTGEMSQSSEREKEEEEKSEREATDAGTEGSFDSGEALGPGNQWNSTEAADDYDSYDYGEPKLPPSLPNLIIFPFVAADAVVKEERVDLHEEAHVKRIEDQSSVVFKDYFSPPIKTEGGFVPKEPSTGSFDELPYLEKESREPPKEDLNGTSAEAPDGLSSSAESQRTELTPFDYTASLAGYLKLKSTPSSGLVQTEKASDFLYEGHSQPVRKSQQTKNPVTVTYKNVVVDFYPNYLITTIRSHSTRHSVKNPPMENPVADPGDCHQKNPAMAPFPTTASDSVLVSFHGTNTSDEESGKQEPPPEELAATKHKYSSKIKNLLGRPKVEDGAENANHKFDSRLSPSEWDSKGPAATPGSSVAEEPGFRAGESFPDEEKAEEGTGERPNAGAVFKLAGCNIYGMMYRIGKVITELSGPCVECLCTDFGVQCRPLKC